MLKSNNIKGIICDLWGVIHDGHSLYPNVLNKLKEFKDNGIDLVFLSNAPRRVEQPIKILESMGIGRDLYKNIMTSGEVFCQEITKKYSNCKAFFIGADKDLNLLDGMNINLTDKAENAKFGIITGFKNKNETVEGKKAELQNALDMNLDMYCINPDLVVRRQNGEEEMCAGIIALEYKKMGGNVINIGKPYNLVYEYAFNLLNIPKAEVIAIGDSLITDIKGANNIGIKSIFCTDGIYIDEINKNGIDYVLKKYNTKPTIIVNNLEEIVI